MANENYYDNLDLKYPEIAIAIQSIDRMNPGKVKFVIPALTPDYSSTEEISKTIMQNKQNIQNYNKDLLTVGKISMVNYIEIYLPRELTVYLGQEYTLTGTIEIEGNSESTATGAIAQTSSEGAINFSNATINANGTVDDEGGNINVTGSISGSNGTLSISGPITGTINLNGTGSYNITEGKITLTPTDRYIAKGSKWVVIFVAGDINKPQIIGRYYD